MKTAVFSAHTFEKSFLQEAAKSSQIEFHFFEAKLSMQTAVLTRGFSAISCFVNDQLNAEVIAQLAEYGVQVIALRSAGFNHVDVQAAKRAGITVLRVPAYSPYAIAEYAVGMILTLNRKIHRAFHRVREQNFSLEGLLGFDLHNSTVGIIGTGKIGGCFASIMKGFGCRLLAYDVAPNAQYEKDYGVQYVSLAALYQESDVISLHCPLNTETRHLLNAEAFAQMKTGVMIINTGRGALIDTAAVIQFLKNQKIGYLGLDVYEEEENLFFEDLSETIIQDDLFSRLQTFPNVLITAHQAFFTDTAMHQIAECTCRNIQSFFAKQIIAANKVI